MPTSQTILRRLGARLLSSLPILLGVLVFTFVLMRLLPGDPAILFASGPNAGPEEIAAVRAELGLDKPLPTQILLFLRDVAQGDLGNSIITGQPVTRDLAERLPASFELTGLALIMALVVSLPLGVAAALNRGSLLDHAIRLLCTAGVAVPTFVTGLVLIYVFYYLLGWAPDPTGRLDIFLFPPDPITGFLLIDAALVGDWEVWSAAAAQILLPASTMALFIVAPLARMTRASMLGVLESDFLRTAEALGLPRRRIILGYALRNALLPVITTTGIMFSALLGASVLVEKIFSWPGVGSYALDALLASDYAPVQGFILLMATLFILINLTVDILYMLADPRVSL